MGLVARVPATVERQGEDEKKPFRAAVKQRFHTRSRTFFASPHVTLPERARLFIGLITMEQDWPAAPRQVRRDVFVK